MNIENINKLITYLKALPPQQFNMAQWLLIDGSDKYAEKYVDKKKFIHDVKEHTCGTVGCIAGHAYTLMVREAVEERSGLRILGDTGESYSVRDLNLLYSEFYNAQEYLGLDLDTAEELFTPDNFTHTEYEDVSLDSAIKVLEHLRDTGDVEWSMHL